MCPKPNSVPCYCTEDLGFAWNYGDLISIPAAARLSDRPSICLNKKDSAIETPIRRPICPIEPTTNIFKRFVKKKIN